MASLPDPGASPDSPADVDLVALRCFATVAEHLHFGRAAAALNISRPQLSRTVTGLEAALGVELFERPAEATELTEAGRALLDRARVLLAAEAEAEGARAREVHGIAPDPNGSPVFTIAIVPGVTVSKWTRVWAERRPALPVRVRPVDLEAQVTVLRERVADVAFVRLPLSPDDAVGLAAIPLYAEAAVVVVPVDHEVTLVDSVSVAELVFEHLLQDPDTVPEWRDAVLARPDVARRPLPVSGAASAAASTGSMADAIALVAAGLGIVIVPQSVARLNHRKDVTYRPVVDVAQYAVALAWLVEAATADVEEFIGIVRGRSERSSRTPSTAADTATPAAGTVARQATGGQGARAPRRAAATPRRGGSDATGATSSARKSAKAPGKPRRPRGSR